MSARALIEALTSRLYHATARDFDRFEIGHEGKNSWAFGAWPVKRSALFFTQSPEFAGEFIADPEQGGYKPGARLHPVRLNLKQTLRLDKSLDLYALGERIGINPKWVFNKGPGWELFDDEDGALFVAALRRAGYDSAIFLEDDGDRKMQTTYAVFDPTVIQSDVKPRAAAAPRPVAAPAVTAAATEADRLVPAA